MRKIKCEYCDGILSKCNEDYPFETVVLGKISIPDIPHFKCSACGGYVVPYESASLIFDYIKAKEDDAIASLPFKDFITPKQALEILGYTKQNFSKNPRIKNGFILSAIKDGKKYYLKKSVELFSKTNDGRFLIVTESISSVWHKVVSEIWNQRSDVEIKSKPKHNKTSTWPNYNRLGTNLTSIIADNYSYGSGNETASIA